MNDVAGQGGGPERSIDEGHDAPRLFVAVPLGDEAGAAVAQLVQEVQARIEAAVTGQRSQVRWVRMDGLHLTLRFLGPTPESRIADLAAIVDESAAAAHAFPVSIRDSGAFPSPKRPRTIWLGIDEGSAALAALAAGVNDRLARAGWPGEARPFRPHLTLARADGRREGPAVANLLSERARTFETRFDARRLVLFESVTGGGPARYVARHAANLGA